LAVVGFRGNITTTISVCVVCRVPRTKKKLNLCSEIHRRRPVGPKMFPAFQVTAHGLKAHADLPC
jgi:hypothetical protein